MDRRDFICLMGAASAAAMAGPLGAAEREKMRPFELDELSLAELQQGLAQGRYSAVSLTEKYLARIRAIDKRGPALNSVIELNPDAVRIARRLDRERRLKGARGPLHGIPVLVKDNLATHDKMRTTAGSLALRESIAPRDSFVVRKLRDAGAVLLGKTNLSEWANFRGSRSTSGWSARGGQTRNPYVLDRNPSGSSSGSGVAVSANLCAVAVGTETDGSILSPSSYNGIVGIKPTVGLISRAGIIPISKTQDTAGPMARTVADAALLLGVLAGSDPEDEATARADEKGRRDYSMFLDPDGLRGARLGVPRKLFSSSRAVVEIAERALARMEALGAVLIDPADLPSHGKIGGSEYEVMLYEFKAGLNAYLAGLGAEAPVRTLAEVIEFNNANREVELPWFGQETLERAQAKGPLTDEAYLKALEACRKYSRDEGIDAIMDEHNLTALVAPTTGPAHVTDYVYGDRGAGGSTSPAAVAGYPSITVPAGHIHGLPVGLSFFGRAWSEPELLRVAFAFEKATQERRAPGFLPTLGG